MDPVSRSESICHEFHCLSGPRRRVEPAHLSWLRGWFVHRILRTKVFLDDRRKTLLLMPTVQHNDQPSFHSLHQRHLHSLKFPNRILLSKLRKFHASRVGARPTIPTPLRLSASFKRIRQHTCVRSPHTHSELCVLCSSAGVWLRGTHSTVVAETTTRGGGHHVARHRAMPLARGHGDHEY